MPSFIDELGDSNIEEFEIEYKGKQLKFKMKEIIGVDDAALVQKYIVTGQAPNWSGLWRERLTRSILEPQLTGNDIDRLPRKILQGLQKNWFRMNNTYEGAAAEAAFLGI